MLNKILASVSYSRFFCCGYGAEFRLTAEKSEPGSRQTYYFKLTQILELYY
jgi:hypothetical protein